MKCEYRKEKPGRNLLPALLLAAGLLAPLPALAALPVSLDQVPVPEPVNIGRFVKDKPAAIRLGKALFWDMQLGSDGIQACASCHFHAGADNRARNAVNPGGDDIFQARPRPDAVLSTADFPFFKPSNPDFRPTDPNNPGVSTTLRNVNDVTSSQGVPLNQFQGLRPGQSTDAGRTLRDDVFARDGRNVRRVAGRNAPTVINAVFNFANFWDGRAHHFFNGVNPFGIMDTAARVFINQAGALTPLDLTGNLTDNPFALNNSGLASQAVGPPLSDFEMSWAGRSFPEIGRKLLALVPLAKQRVHPADSVLGSAIRPGGIGLTGTYEAMIRAAFQDEFWNSTATVTIANQSFSQMEANFSLLFGLAVQLYEATLVSADTPFDRFLRGNPAAMTDQQLRGMNLFFSGGTACADCHAGAELTAATVGQLLAPGEPGMVELMGMADGGLANYDIGFYNIGVRPTTEDVGRGQRLTLNGVDMPLSFTGQHFERAGLPFTPLAQPGCANDFLADPPTICPPPQDPVSRMAVRGAFKTPGLRNVELTGPYMHNGGMATLRQVVDFYVRGGDFREANIADLDPLLDGIGGLRGKEAEKNELVAFLLALTDDRVRQEAAPFDHPQLFIPDGHENKIPGNPKRLRVHADKVREIPAVGAAGRQAQGLPPLKPFLADDLTGADLAGFHFRP